MAAVFVFFIANSIPFFKNQLETKNGAGHNERGVGLEIKAIKYGYENAQEFTSIFDRILKTKRAV